MLTPRIKWRDPVGLGSVDGAVMCRCDDNLEYVVKDTTAQLLTPHNEWFCTLLAGEVGVVCPPCCPVEDEAGDLATTFLSFEDVLARIDAVQAPKARGSYKMRVAANSK